MKFPDTSLRIKKYTKSEYAYNCYPQTKEYIYAEDYNNAFNHKSSITNEEKNELFKKNFPKFAKGIDKIYIPLWRYFTNTPQGQDVQTF